MTDRSAAGSADRVTPVAGAATASENDEREGLHLPSVRIASDPWLRVSMHANRRQIFDLSFGEAQRDRVVLDLGDRADRDRDLPLPPQVAALEDEVRDVGLVDHEPVDLAEEMVISRDDCARTPDLHVSLRNAVVLDTHIADPAAVAHELWALVVRQSEDVFDADVPVRIARGSLAHAKVGELVDLVELADVLGCAPQSHFVPIVTAVLDKVDRNEAGTVVLVLRLDDEMSHLLCDRIDDHVRELAVELVRATNRLPQLESHALLLPALQSRESADFGGRVFSLSPPSRVCIIQSGRSRLVA